MSEGKPDRAGTLAPGESTRDLRAALRRNLDDVRARIDAACRRAGRDSREVTLVAVSKTVPASTVALLAELGQVDFGENRVQDALAKIPECPPGLRWHFIGHLQRNKAARALERFDVLHAIDSAALGQTLERAAEASGRPLTCFLEVNVSGEASKHGFTMDAVPDAALALAGQRFARPAGLMTMAPLDPDPQRARPHFRALRELRDALNRRLPDAARLTHLSMGMTQDFEAAIEEGATFVRVGSALFRDLPPCRA